MRHSIIFAGAAALAITAPALAKPEGGKGGGQGGPAKVERGGGGGGPQRAERGGGPRQQVRGPERRDVRSERRAERQQVRADRGPAREQREVRRAARSEQRSAERREQRQVRATQSRGERIVERRDAVRVERRDAGRIERGDRRIVTAVRDDTYFASPAFRTTGLVDGCPPGLAAKGNGCLPPGQARKLVGAAIPATLGSALLPPLYRNWYPDSDDYYYRTSDGYVYRIDRDRNLVDAYWPIADEWDGAYYVGAAYPQDYLGYYNVPVQYQPWYADNDDYYYRYGDGAIYQVDRGDGLIESIVSLLAGGTAVGQPLPAGYDVYNVPYAYRDRYVDSPDAWYRYNDGYIYEVDPTTRIVQAIVETLV